MYDKIIIGDNKMIITENFDDYDQVLEYYKSTLNYWKNYQNSRIINKNQQPMEVVLLKPTIIVKVYVNSAISKMLRNMETLKHSPEISEDLYNRFLKNVYIKNQLDKYVIKKKDSLSESEIINSIRGMVAHADFKIVNENKMICISLDNEQIRAVLPFPVIDGISNVIRDYKLLHTKRDTFIVNYDKLTELNTTKQSEWKEALDQLRIIKLKNGISEYFNPVFSKIPKEATSLSISSNKKINIQQKKLDAERKRLISKYLRYFGESTWTKMSSAYKKNILTAFLSKIVNNEIYDAHSEYYFIKPLQKEGEYFYKTPLMGDKENYFDHAINTPYISPFAFTSVFADYAFYALNFAKEAATKDKINEEIYKDIEVQDVEILMGNQTNYINYIDNPQYLIDEKTKLIGKRKRLRKKIREYESQKENISKSKRVSDEDKVERINFFDNALVEKNKELENIEYLIELTNNKISNFKPHYSYTTEFFRRLRNGITHSYEVDYSEGLYTRNYDNMTITFSDCEHGDDFKAKIRIGELEKIISILTERVKQEYPFYHRHQTIELNLATEDHENHELVEKLESKMNEWSKDTNFKYIIAEDSSESIIDDDLIIELFSNYGLDSAENSGSKGERKI